MPKNVKGVPLGVFEHSFFCKVEKNEGGPFRAIKKNCEKFSTQRYNAQKNFWSRAELEPTSFCLADLKKSEAEEATLVWQLAEPSL